MMALIGHGVNKTIATIGLHAPQLQCCHQLWLASLACGVSDAVTQWPISATTFALLIGDPKN